MTELIAAFKALRLHGMATGYAELLGNGGPGVETAEWIVRHLLEAEKTDRALRSVRYQMHAARFPLHRDLAGFEFEQSKVDQRQIEAFATLAFTEKAENIVLIGGTGTGNVSADGKLTHPADRKLTHLGRGWRPLGGRLDVDPGGSSGSEGVGPSGQRGA